jgi:hypothetical protein
MDKIILPWVAPHDAVSAAVKSVTMQDFWKTLLLPIASRPEIMDDNPQYYRSMMHLLTSMRRIVREDMIYIIPTSERKKARRKYGDNIPRQVHRLAEETDTLRPIIDYGIYWLNEGSINEPNDMYSCFRCLTGVIYMYRKDEPIIRMALVKLFNIMHRIYTHERAFQFYPSALKDIIHLSPAIDIERIADALNCKMGASLYNRICDLIGFDDAAEAREAHSSTIEEMNHKVIITSMKVPAFWSLLLASECREYFLPACAILLVHPGTPKEILDAISKANISQYSIIKDIAKLRAGKTGNMKDCKLEPLYDIKAMF